MVTYFYKENKKITLNPEKRDAICSSINSMFKKYYKDLIPSFRETGNILKELFPSMKDNNKISKIPDLYEQYQTYISALRRACYPDYRAIVDIEGLNLRSNQLASAYKSSLVYDWYNIDLMKQLAKTCDNWTIKGEAAFYVCWKQEVYQQTTTLNNEFVNELGEVVNETIKVRENVPTFEGVDVKSIDPHNLFFDRSQKDDWDNCRKVYRDFVPLEDILANTSYKLTPDERKALKELVKSSQKDVSVAYNNTGCNEETKVYGNTVEVLEFEGTFTMPDSLETIRRVEATVIAGIYLAKFQESDKPKSPYIWECYLERPDTGRGQSPLKIPSILNDVQNMCMDLVMRCYLLITNPPFLAQRGALPESTNVQAGKPIYWSPDVTANPPQKLDFSAGLSGYNMIDFLKNKAQSATGVTQYLQGSQDGSVRTASEASYIHAGASMRMANEAAKFSYVIEKLVRLFALYKKVFDTNDREVRLEDGSYAIVDEEVRNGDYKFLIGGAQSVISREAETQKIFQLFGLPVVQSLSSIMDPLAAARFLKWAMNRLNLQGTEQITEMLDINTALRQYAEQQGIQNKNIPEFQEDMRNYIKDNIPQIGNQLIQQRLNQLPPEQNIE